MLQDNTRRLARLVKISKLSLIFARQCLDGSAQDSAGTGEHGWLSAGDPTK